MASAAPTTAASSPMARWRKPPIAAFVYISPARSSKRRMRSILRRMSSQPSRSGRSWCSPGSTGRRSSGERSCSSAGAAAPSDESAARCSSSRALALAMPAGGYSMSVGPGARSGNSRAAADQPALEQRIGHYETLTCVEEAAFVEQSVDRVARGFPWQGDLRQSLLGGRRPRCAGDDYERPAITVRETLPQRRERLPELLPEILEHAGQGRLVGHAPLGRTLPQEVRREHRALRVAPHEVEQRAERRPGVATRRLEALGDERREVAVRQRSEKDAAGLAIEWTLAIGEQRPHHPRVRAGEDVPDVVAVLLDDALEGAVERGREPMTAWNSSKATTTCNPARSAARRGRSSSVRSRLPASVSSCDVTSTAGVLIVGWRPRSSPSTHAASRPFRPR